MSDIIYTPPTSGGTGNISGTLTPTYVPYASGVNTISNSIIYNDVTNSRIGIGTSSPSFSLDIVGQIINTARLNSVGRDTRLYLQNTTTGSTNNDGLLIGMISNDTYFYNYENGSTIFGTNNLERMRITSAGNVGIGTTNPTSKVSIVGGNDNSLLVDNDGSTYTSINIASLGSRLGSIVTQNTVGSKRLYIESTQGNFDFFALTNITFGTGTGYPERMRITSAGRVGIGTTAPSRELEVNGLIVTNRTSNSDGAVFFGSGGSRYFYSPDSGGYIATYTNAIERMIVTSAGSVGIGTSSPVASAQLQVVSPNADTGFLCPQLEDAQIRAIVSPAEGLMVYNTTISHMCFYQAGAWVKISHSPM